MKKFASVLCLFLAVAVVARAGDRPLPSPQALEWADAEVGVLIHYEMFTYHPNWNWEDFDHLPPASSFAPTELDTDQWVRTAKAAGANYVVLVAKHNSGFCLWPTAVHDYCIKSSPWRGGKGDIVGDFFASCRKYGVKPGLYYSVASNSYYHVKQGRVQPGGPVTQEEFNRIVIRQLTELWTNYGPVFEIWFDGGVLPLDQGGPDLRPVFALQPDAIFFQGPAAVKNLVRWSGNELGRAPWPNWATVDHSLPEKGWMSFDHNWNGNPDGDRWCPVEADLPNRYTFIVSGWGWRRGLDWMVLPLHQLMNSYYKSVGRGANMIIGMAIDTRGLVPEADQRRFKQFGNEVRRRFQKPLAETSGHGNRLEIDLGAMKLFNHVVLMEDISQGQRVRQYQVEGFNGRYWFPLASGSSIGHKTIHRFPPLMASHVRLTVEQSAGEPVIRSFRLYLAH